MLKKKNGKKLLGLFLTMCFVLQTVCIPTFASEEKTPTATTVITVIDNTTGEKTEFQVNNNVTTEKSIDENGNPISISTFEVGGKNSMLRAGQTNYGDCDGWRGTVSIRYTDDGTYASLSYAEGKWEQERASTIITSTSMTYGQDLGTNARNGSITIPTSTLKGSVSLNWPPGKYGSGKGHKVGATLIGTIRNKTYHVACNVVF